MSDKARVAKELTEDMGPLTPLVKRFLEEAGEHAEVLVRMMDANFEPNTMVLQCGTTAKSHGFWDAHKVKAYEKLCQAGIPVEIAENVSDILSEARLIGDPTIFMALMVTEMAEAIEAYRKNNKVGKDGMWEELADVVVRLFDFIARFGPDDEVTGQRFMALVAAKMAKNESRQHLHGKAF